MKKAKTVPPEAIQFNARHASVMAGAKLLRDELLKNMSFAKKLAKEASSLYRYGEKKCYVDNEITYPIDGIKDLGSKMDNLDWLASNVPEELKYLADSLVS